MRWQCLECFQYIFILKQNKYKRKNSRKFIREKAKMNSSATNGVADEPPGSVSALKSGIERLRNLESVFLEGPVNAHEAKCFSTETLLDVLMVLFNECCNSSLRKEKTVTEFIELGKSKISKQKNKHLQNDRLCQIKLSQARLVQVRLGKIRLSQIRIGQARLGTLGKVR